MFSLDRWLILAAVLAAHAAALWGLTNATPLLPAASAEPSRLVAQLITLESTQPAPRAPAPVKPESPSLPAPAKPARTEPVAAKVAPTLAASTSNSAPPTAAASAASPPSDSPATEATPAAVASSPTASVDEAEAEITPPSAQASHLSNRAPRYPAISRRLGEEGEVVVRLLVLADGSVGTVDIEQSSGYPRLDAAALDAARQWRFVPAHRGGQALDAWHTQALRFQLDA